MEGKNLDLRTKSESRTIIVFTDFAKIRSTREIREFEGQFCIATGFSDEKGKLKTMEKWKLGQQRKFK